MGNEMEMIVMDLIVNAGNAKSQAMQAISLAKKGKTEEAKAAIEKSSQDLAKAHQTQTGLIQEAARGNEQPINIFMVHAQDHLMTAMLARDLANEFVELYQKIAEK
jgi:PTS system cellobiose-specific IIA component